MAGVGAASAVPAAARAREVAAQEGVARVAAAQALAVPAVVRELVVQAPPQLAVKRRSFPEARRH